MCRPADGLLGAVLEDRTVVLWNLHQGRQVGPAAAVPFEVACVAPLDCGRTMVSGAADRLVVAVHGVSEPDRVQLLDAHSVAREGVRSVAGHGDLIAALAAETVLVWSVARAELVASLAVPSPLDRIGFTPRGHLVGLGPGGALAWAADDLVGPVSLVVPPNGPRWPLLNEDGSWAAIGGSTAETRNLAGDELLTGRPPVHMLFYQGGRLGVRYRDATIVAHPQFAAVSPWQVDDQRIVPIAYVGQLAVGEVAAVVSGRDGLLAFATPRGQLTVVDATREKWLKREPKPPKPKPVAAPPGTYPAHRVITSETSIDADVFWKLIETSHRLAASADNEDLSDQADRQAEILEDLLIQRTPEEIAGFDQFFCDRFEESYRSELWAVAEIAGGGCSDDGFEYFRCWLIGQGKRYYQRALADPQRAADRIREAGDLPGSWDLIMAADSAYESVTGQPIPARKRLPARELTGAPYEAPEDFFPRLNRRFWGD